MLGTQAEKVPTNKTPAQLDSGLNLVVPSQDEEGGYCKPPKHSQFKKGQSGNPSGRPPGSKNAATIAIEQLNKPLRVKIDGKLKTMSALEVAAQQLMKRGAEKGDLKAIGFLLQMAGQVPGGVGAKGASDKGPSSEATDPVDMQILAFSTREHMTAAGLSDDMADSLLLAMGLKPAIEK
ncbi:hypothetical protein LHFGNBLO_002788 [Mesorhizobium sp. AR10]|uniref:DUF5681 domain-containing protein n=1 Tax=Mesorhizobium sp. AR10 TaxID=2865839 RepID=UPI002160F34A|nr:DUF5681 domain-containing protein [Mesorhizobium sp. AR10]UVK41214.1 hypothetical protein LHFGNBLO_002788 [Mesorhizobium sp. AR10]